MRLVIAVALREGLIWLNENYPRPLRGDSMNVCIRGYIANERLADGPQRSFTFSYQDIAEGAAVERATKDARAQFDVMSATARIVIEHVYVSN